jgi:putative transposase
MFVAENFIPSLVSTYGKHTVYTNGSTWYPQAYNFLHLKYRLHSPIEKSLIERVMQYFKDKTKGFNDDYPCINNNNTNNKQNCDLQHVYKWIKLFIYLYNTTIRNKILIIMEVK